MGHGMQRRFGRSATPSTRRSSGPTSPSPESSRHAESSRVLARPLTRQYRVARGQRARHACPRQHHGTLGQTNRPTPGLASTDRTGIPGP
jgi:hypothetical protein